MKTNRYPERLQAFQEAMQEKLNKRSHRGDWREQSFVNMQEGLHQELQELAKATTIKNKKEELVDIANYCMILWDKWSNP